jgi:membrane protease YdiL (CAAX protease family)
MLGYMLLAANLAIAFVMYGLKYAQLHRDFKWNLKPLQIIAAMLLVVAAMSLSDVITEKLNLTNLLENQLTALSNSFVGILTIALIGPLAEEMVFRVGIEGHLLRKGLKPWYAILISAAIFSIIHLNPAQMLGAFALGILFGWLFYRTGSAIPSILGHVLNNSLCVVLSFAYPDPKTTMESMLGGPLQLWIFVVCCAAAVVALVYYLNRNIHLHNLFVEEAKPQMVEEQNAQVNE